MTEWSTASWRTKPAQQQPHYSDETELARVLGTIAQLPPLVTSGEIELLRKQLAEVCAGTRFVIHGGDCSERFNECHPATIAAKLRILLQIGVILIDASKMKVTRIGRIAGQYAKPRSSMTETRDGVTLPSYQGDLVNLPEFTLDARTPRPQFLLDGLQYSCLVLNFLRGLLGTDYADLVHPKFWDLGFAAQSPFAAMYEQTIARVVDSIRFMEASSGAPMRQLARLDYFISHEALHLPYEEAVTRTVPRRAGWYNLATHLPWVGDRTRALDGAHIEYLRGIQNPVGVKVGPSMTPDELVAVTERLDPSNTPGKIVIIHRFGVNRIAKHLPPLIDAIRRTKRNVVWTCDPMHGNTSTTSQGIKTRSFDHIVEEVRAAFSIHHECGSFLGGIHLELTGENVTECTGGARRISESDLSRDYRSLVDPRLNQEQALELALQIGASMRKWVGDRVVTSET